MIYQSFTDIELLSLLKAGDEHALREIYDRYWKFSLTIAAKKLDNIQDAEDLVNDLFVSMWNRRDAWPEILSLQNYFKRAIRNQVLKIWAKKYRIEKYLLIQQSSIFEYEYQSSNSIEYKELNGQLKKAISDLPEKCRLVFELSREEGLSQKQISNKLGISQKTVEAHINKALKMLRINLRNYFMNFFF
ncbi:RNA polymerase sigma-70 factor [Pedobacter ginsengiterrae]|uniref:RNA polymerase sigma-70 factor n=1 Tax=Pedobacter ginsengiterrae TaxID=871696 RepID=A0ABP7NMT6_9SPHI